MRKKKTKQPRHRRRLGVKGWGRWLTWIAFIGAAVILVYVAFFLGQDRLGADRVAGVSASGQVAQASSSNTNSPDSTQPTGALGVAEDRTNILLLGVDQRERERGNPTRSDTIMVATVESKSKTAGLLSIPRDLYVSIPEWKDGASTGSTIEHKINTANFYGDYWDYPGGGPALAAETIELNLGIPIDYYICVDFKSFERAIDAIGGITVDVEEDLIDTAYPDDQNEGKTITVYFEAGTQRLDGKRALQYARTRNPDSDFGRMHRQQTVMMAVRQKLLEPGTWLRVPSVVQTLYGAIRTNMPLHEIIGLANTARDIERDDIVFRSIDSTMVTAETAPNGAEVLVPKWSPIRMVIREVFSSPSGG